MPWDGPEEEKMKCAICDDQLEICAELSNILAGYMREQDMACELVRAIKEWAKISLLKVINFKEVFLSYIRRRLL